MTKEQKALLVIDALCADQCLKVNDIANHPKDCFYCVVYMVAHSASSSCAHETWLKQTEEMYKHFAK